MSIVTEITRINTNIANSYTAVDNKNGTLPQVQNSANLASSIDSIEVIEQATAEGESLSLTNTKAMPYSDYVVEGKSEQEGEPSPSNPSEIHSVADDVNLFDLKNFLSDRNVSYTENEDGSLTFITSSALYLSPLQFSNEDIIVSMSGILTTLEEMSNAKIEILNSNNTVVGQINLSNSKIENITGSKLRFNMTSNKTITLRNIKLQKGTVATPYSKYGKGTVTIKQRGTTESDDFIFQTEPLRSLPNGVKDTIEADGIHRRVGRIVLNGSETITTHTYGTNSYQVSGDINTNFKSDEIQIISNYFKGVSNDDRASSGNNIIYTTTNTTFVIRNTGFETVEQFTTWLSNNNTEVLYELEQEIIEPLTQNQATTMLDIIKTGSYEGTTNICTDEDVKPTMKVEYYKKS